MSNPNTIDEIKTTNEAQTIYGGHYPMGPYSPAGCFSEQAHENLLRSKGFKAIHYKHALNPARETPAEGVDMSKMDYSGFVYYDPQEFYVTPQGIRWEDLLLMQNAHGKNTLTVNHTGKYNGTDSRVYLRKGDIIVASHEAFGTVLVTELVEYKLGQPLRLKFPSYAVDYLAADGTRYEQNSDFICQDGLVYWLDTGRKPRFDAAKNRGEVLSIVYWTQPVFVVVDTPRIFRTVWANEFADTRRPQQAIYLPGSAVLMMSWMQPQIKIDGHIMWPGISLPK
jgi:hypothetical protein